MSATDKGEMRSGATSEGSAGERGKSETPRTQKSPTRPADVGRALRSVYDDTLREDIPSDLKDLLGRLG